MGRKSRKSGKSEEFIDLKKKIHNNNNYNYRSHNVRSNKSSFSLPILNVCCLQNIERFRILYPKAIKVHPLNRVHFRCCSTTLISRRCKRWKDDDDTVWLFSSIDTNFFFLISLLTLRIKTILNSVEKTTKNTFLFEAVKWFQFPYGTEIPIEIPFHPVEKKKMFSLFTKSHSFFSSSTNYKLKHHRTAMVFISNQTNRMLKLNWNAAPHINYDDTQK